MLGSESAMEGAFAEARGGRMPLVESEGSNEAAMTKYHRRYSIKVLRSPICKVCDVAGDKKELDALTIGGCFGLAAQRAQTSGLIDKQPKNFRNSTGSTSTFTSEMR